MTQQQPLTKTQNIVFGSIWLTTLAAFVYFLPIEYTLFLFSGWGFFTIFHAKRVQKRNAGDLAVFELLLSEGKLDKFERIEDRILADPELNFFDKDYLLTQMRKRISAI